MSSSESDKLNDNFTSPDAKSFFANDKGKENVASTIKKLGLSKSKEENVTSKLGTKLIERCINDLDEIIVQRKRALRDIHKSGGFRSGGSEVKIRRKDVRIFKILFLYTSEPINPSK